MYSIDTSALLEGWVRVYPPDHFPAVWERIEELINNGEFLASQTVLWDLEKKSDELYKWCTENEEMFVPIDDDVQEIMRDIMANYPKLVDTRTGKSGSDSFVIALAQIYDPMLTVVTAEQGGALDRPKIPIVCREEGIRCINLLGLIQEQGWKF